MTQQQSEQLLGKQVVTAYYENDNGDETLRLTFDDHTQLYFYVNSNEGHLIFTEPEK